MTTRANCLWLLSGLIGVALLAMHTGCKEKESTSKPDKKPEGAESLVKVPLGLPELWVPEDNPLTAEKIELGKLLYFDPRLSKDGNISCATCHDPRMAWAEHKPTSEGIGGQFGARNAPTVINAAYLEAQFWDGRAATLEEQALGPIENPIEMGHSMVEVRKALTEIEEYKQLFKAAFGDEKITDDRVAKAIASFERTVLSGNSPYDKFRAGDENALTDRQKRGMNLFEKKFECSVCHDPDTGIFSNGKYYNAGIGMDTEPLDEGRKDVTGEAIDLGKFRVPPLREVEHTAPYFHDGSAATLEDAVRLMAGGGIDNDNLSAIFKGMQGLNPTDEEIVDLVAFLKALSGEYPVMDLPVLPGQ